MLTVIFSPTFHFFGMCALLLLKNLENAKTTPIKLRTRSIICYRGRARRRPALLASRTRRDKKTRRRTGIPSAENYAPKVVMKSHAIEIQGHDLTFHPLS